MNAHARSDTDAWHDRANEFAAAAHAPDSSTEEYVWLVWAFAQLKVDALSSSQCAALAALAPALRGLRYDPWVLRFLECAARDADALALGGGERTAWLTAQRRAHAGGSLPAGRVRLLEHLRGFTWTPGADRWEATFERVRDFAETRGHIPARGDDETLSRWLAAQRFALRSGRLDTARSAALEALPGWSSSLSNTRSRRVWSLALTQLQAFVAEHHRYPQTSAPEPAEVLVAWWVWTQRELHRRGDLSGYRADALCALPGWRWAAREADFDARADQLRRELAGAQIGTDHPLYGWVVSQRRRHRDGRLSTEQASTLRSLNLLQDFLAGAAA